jgi:hypothetical protein
VSSTAYYLCWLVAGLALSALASACIARYLRRRIARKVKAAEAMDALARYSFWVNSQRRTAFFHGNCRDADGPLSELQLAIDAAFPDLQRGLAQLLACHARVVDFLWTQHVVRLTDPEAWLESDADAAFAPLWSAHLSAAQSLAHRLQSADNLATRPAAEEAAGFPA